MKASDYEHLYKGVSFNNGKMELRKLSDMTKSEGNEWADLKDKVWHDKSLTVQALGELTQWLLSKHFDIFNLIPAGLAIDKTKQ